MIANNTIWEKSTLTHRQCSKCILGRKKQTVEHYWSWTGLFRAWTATFLKQCRISSTNIQRKGLNVLPEA